MIEMTEYATVMVTTPIVETECEECYSLQPCLYNDLVGVAVCADWDACRTRQQENKHDLPIKMTPAEVRALAEAYDRQCGEIERLQRIESAVREYRQARDLYKGYVGSISSTLILFRDMTDAESRLVELVK